MVFGKRHDLASLVVCSGFGMIIEGVSCRAGAAGQSQCRLRTLAIGCEQGALSKLAEPCYSSLQPSASSPSAAMTRRDTSFGQAAERRIGRSRLGGRWASLNDAAERAGNRARLTVVKPVGLRRQCLAHSPAPPWCDPTGYLPYIEPLMAPGNGIIVSGVYLCTLLSDRAG